MDIFDVLAEPTRRDIIEMLSIRGQLSATQIYDRFDVSAPAISQHLRVLRVADVVVVEKKAQKRLYKINPKSIQEVEDWVKKLKKQWNDRLDVFEKVLQEEKSKL